MDKSRIEYEKIITNMIRFNKYEPRNYIINPDKKIVYLINSKVACTSIKISLFDCPVQSDETIHLLLQGYQKYEINKDDYSDYFIFTYVRNPFERLVSCYKNKVLQHKEYYQNYLGGIFLKTERFDDFVDKIINIPDIIADRHFKSQYSLIYKGNKQLVDYIGKMENIQESYHKIAEKYGLTELPHYNKTKKDNWMEYYTISTAKKVYKRYKKDFKKFNYDDLYFHLLDYLKNNDRN